jgi:hypothetical protein
MFIEARSHEFPDLPEYHRAGQENPGNQGQF